MFGGVLRRMTRDPLRAISFAATIVALAFIEWVLFELIRAPYRPPKDMTTFLGTEKYAVIAFMLLLALFGLGLMCLWAVRSAWTKRDIAAVAILVTVIMGAGIYVVIKPSWPVTPLNWVLR
jgi:hypothetical protein